MKNPLIVNDEELAKLTYRIAGENGSQISVDEICNLVFTNPESNNTLGNPIDIKQETLSFC